MIRIDAYRDRTILLLGLARSNLAAARALRAGGATVLGWDDGAPARERAAAAGIVLAEPEGIDWPGIAALVAAPGVPLTHPAPHPLIAAAKAAAVPVIGDVELFLNTKPVARIVGITGTNGKSTTTALIGHILDRAGRANAVGGNIGRPVLDLQPLAEDGTYVLELSSFQLDLTPSCHLDVAVLLNVSAGAVRVARHLATRPPSAHVQLESDRPRLRVAGTGICQKCALRAATKDLARVKCPGDAGLAVEHDMHRHIRTPLRDGDGDGEVSWVLLVVHDQAGSAALGFIRWIGLRGGERRTSRCCCRTWIEEVSPFYDVDRAFRLFLPPFSSCLSLWQLGPDSSLPRAGTCLPPGRASPCRTVTRTP